MIVIGITGSIAMGKSTAANMLRDMGIPVHDSDAAVHDLLSKGGDGIGPVISYFPDSFNKKTQEIDRKKLKSLLHHDHENLTLLEKVLHPLVQNKQQDFLKSQQSKGMKIAGLDIPLLFETGAERRIDYTICVSAPAHIQKQRIQERGMSEEDFAFFLSRQMPDKEKRARADFTVQSGLGLAPMRSELEAVIKEIKSRE